MFKRIFTYLITSFLILIPVAYADTILLQKSGPTTFATLNGVAGLGAESLTGGAINVNAGGATASAALDATGTYSLTVGAGVRFEINASYQLDGMPAVNVRHRNVPQLLENEIRQYNLLRPSGRVLGKVIVTGGTLEQISMSAFSGTIDGGALVNYSATDTRQRTGSQDPEVLLAMPSGIPTDIFVSIRATSSNGCTVVRDFTKRTVILSDATVVTTPNVVVLPINVSAETCDSGNINGIFQLNGMDPAATLSTHSMSFFGPDAASISLTAFGPYQTGPLTEGGYLLLQNTTFNPPYGTLSYPPVELIDIPSGNVSVTYNSTHSVGMAHGSLILTGDWSLADTATSEVIGTGSFLPAGSNPASNYAAFDQPDASTGNFDFILASGVWDIDRYNFTFNTSLNGRIDNSELDLRLLSGIGLDGQVITEGQHINLAPVTLDTTITPINFQVEQQPGQPPVTIDQLTISGSSQTLAPPADTTVRIADITHTNSGDPMSNFDVTVYGLPGNYLLTASGIGSDGNLYVSTFAIDLTHRVSAPDPFTCFAVNKMKVHMHDGKIYINDGAFAVPDGSSPDLSQQDVTFIIDGIEYTIPAGSFRQVGHKQDYLYKTPRGQKPALMARLNFKKATWKLKIRDENASLIDNSDGVDVSLVIGNIRGDENIVLTEKHKHEHHGHKKRNRKYYDHHADEDETRLMYKRKPKVRCAPHHDDHDDDDKDDDHHGHHHDSDKERKQCKKGRKS